MIMFVCLEPTANIPMAQLLKLDYLIIILPPFTNIPIAPI
jgi:hypothetical protein